LAVGLDQVESWWGAQTANALGARPAHRQTDRLFINKAAVKQTSFPALSAGWVAYVPSTFDLAEKRDTAALG